MGSQLGYAHTCHWPITSLHPKSETLSPRYSHITLKELFQACEEGRAVAESNWFAWLHERRREQDLGPTDIVQGPVLGGFKADMPVLCASGLVQEVSRLST